MKTERGRGPGSEGPPVSPPEPEEIVRRKTPPVDTSEDFDNGYKVGTRRRMNWDTGILSKLKRGGLKRVDILHLFSVWVEHLNYSHNFCTFRESGPETP